MNSPSDNESTGLEALLNICDQLESLRGSMEVAEESNPDNAVLEKKRILSELRETLQDPHHEIQTLLVGPATNLNLDQHDLQLLAVLFHRRLSSEEGFLTGRELLWVNQESTAGLMTEIRRLNGDQALRESGFMELVAMEDVTEKDLLNQGFQLSDGAFLRLCDGRAIARTEGPIMSDQPYDDAMAHLLDMEKLSTLCQQRSVLFFDEGLWHETVFRPGCSLSEARRRAREKADEIHKRTAATENVDDFPLVQLMREYSLEPSELLILLTLFFQECLRGLGVIDVIDLLRLISSTPLELVQNRAIFSSRSRLLQNNLIHVDAAIEGKLSTGQAQIANWAAERLLRPRQRNSTPIQGDDRIAFHEFLTGMESSSEFFDRLG